MKHLMSVLLIAGSLSAAGQVASPQPKSTRPPAGITAPVAQPVNAQLNVVLGQLEQTAQTANVDIAKLRIEKWKADGAVKRQTQENADSIQRNLTAALPAMVQQVRSDPQSLAAVFKLYRNLNVLYDVLTSVTESAGAFGPKNEFQLLATDAQNLDSVRRVLADRLQEMAALRDQEVTRLRTQVAQAQAVPATPKKIIVDDETPKKPVRKKKPAAKPAPKTDTNPGSTTPAAKPQ
jgi:hypothetical protein